MDDVEYVRAHPWKDGEAHSPNSAALTSTHFLSDDFCVIRDEHFFLRCVLQLPQQGVGVWCLVGRGDYEAYRDQFDVGQSPRIVLARLANEVAQLPESFNRKCRLRVIAGRQRPLVELV